ncbi:UNVERIFIED_CONTAM: hypothetical protein N8J90_02785 [Halobacillus marinus]|uniref:hypothetical protein n=1 Tax=Bacillaceae TaxID=186817 RepID=UPI0002A4D197|nr:MULTISPECIES: hypothetical protein [Bacillaceae]ELK44769.1 hypothetical protein D479_17829 [Halobacillus sp. BAB-2008]QHT46681.1 hypothetical protein M662_09325 [Bacillus sp. SB49]
MTGFLLSISFLIDGVLLYAIFILMKRVKQAGELEEQKQETASEIDDLFTSYLAELKDENERLMAWVANTPEQKPVTYTDEHQAKASIRESAPVYTPPVPVEGTEVIYERSLQSQVIDMMQSGLTIEETARKLDRGKTEVELLYKWSQKTSEKT